MLGLGGEVGERSIGRLLDGRDPGSGEQLRRPLASGAVAGFDLTFRAPKSVSILFGIADPAVSEKVCAAHEHAVGEALAYLDRRACRARRGHGGALQVTGDGFVGAAFRHRSSRAGDPLLHTHVVIANGTRGPDGRWTALDGRPLYRHAKTAGYLYQAILRAELTRRLGVRWLAVENGTADISGVPRAVIAHFSRRRREIVEYMRERGEHSARAAQIATLQTRRRKQYGVPAERLRDEWRARAAAHGLDARRVRRVLHLVRGRSLDPLRGEELATRMLGADGLTRDRSTFTRGDVLQALAEAARGGASIARLEAHADAFLTRDDVVALAEDGGEPRYTTAELLRLECDLLDRAGRRATMRDGAVATPEALDASLAARPTVTAEQRELVVELTRGGTGIAVVRAAAGTGKTFALDAAREAWQCSDMPVLGCALSARAACELRDQAGIDATTIARLTYGLDRGLGLAAGSVLVVDEAGMVGTRDLARLAEAASASAKLVLVGDDRQLPEIQAGGAFRALAERVGAIELRSVRRQRHAWDRSALAALRAGDVERFVRAYDQHGRIVAARTLADARAAMVADWWDAHRRGDDALMIAHRRRDVAELNGAAREVLRAAGRIGDDELVTAQRVFAIGDRVIAGRNDRRLGVVNGQAGTLTAIGADRLVVAFDGRPPVELPRSYAEHGSLDHAYAITAHRAQGATVDRAFVLGSDELYREWGYTALSRHREDVRFYVSAAPDALNRPALALHGDQDATRDAARMLATSRAQQLALDEVVPPLRRAIDPLAALGPRQIDPTRECPPRPELDELGRDVDADIGIGR